jgi:hypothetical protein
MESEATNAKKENIQLLDEWKNREDSCLRLIRQQQKSYEKLTKLRVEREVTLNDTNMQQETLEQMNRYNEMQER